MGSRVSLKYKYLQPLERKSSLKLAKQLSLNLHKNYLDLKPYYDRLKYERACELAETWEKEISGKLGKDVEAEARKSFIKYIESGNKLSFN